MSSKLFPYLDLEDSDIEENDARRNLLDFSEDQPQEVRSRLPGLRKLFKNRSFKCTRKLFISAFCKFFNINVVSSEF